MLLIDILQNVITVSLLLAEESSSFYSQSERSAGDVSADGEVEVRNSWWWQKMFISCDTADGVQAGVAEALLRGLCLPGAG